MHPRKGKRKRKQGFIGDIIFFSFARAKKKESKGGKREKKSVIETRRMKEKNH